MTRREQLEEQIRIYTGLRDQQNEFIKALENMQSVLDNESFSEQIASFREMAKSNESILDRFRSELEALREQ